MLPGRLAVSFVLGLIAKRVSSLAPCRRAVIVGGGPVGLATALTLSRPPHSYNVTLLEQRREGGFEAVSAYDPTRAYLYNVNPRGLQWIDYHPDVLEKLVERGTAPGQGMGSMVIIPADPTQPIPPITGTTVGANITMPNRRNFWVPRHDMVALLQECCKEQEEKRGKGLLAGHGSIEVHAGKKVVDITPDDEEGLVQLHCADGSTYNAGLVVAADGIDSTIRECLANTTRKTWLQKNPTLFRVRKYKSPSTGLKMKCLQFPPDFTLPDSDGTRIPTDSQTIYVLRGVNKGRNNYLSLGLLPMKNPKLVRSANINTRPDHQAWSLKNGAEAKAWFQKAFPRWNFDEFVDDKEWDRFAQASGTTYPYCQYSPGSAAWSPDGSAGVVMVGDACHAFPPDIGQGINAGLQDVLALDRAMQSLDIDKGTELKDKATTLGEALQRYQANRGPEHRALIRLARFGAPYQYRQAWRRDRIGRFLWTANTVFRLLLNKISGGLVPPVAILVAQKHELSFREVMQRADTAVLGLRLLVAGMFARMLALRFF